ncbi:hypothetical protein DPEC_G00087900 [Dallia pectoralis]|uniref:Uncharacterized protein n=1 Tax=Dallia pectoralis TaxID=75939 RepID=A0ACC2GZX6_DALPE|nr:hypothetical protein DPEC_G00087900 [Dallia pectoralis]
MRSAIHCAVVQFQLNTGGGHHKRRTVQHKRFARVLECLIDLPAAVGKHHEDNYRFVSFRVQPSKQQAHIRSTRGSGLRALREDIFGFVNITTSELVKLFTALKQAGP